MGKSKKKIFFIHITTSLLTRKDDALNMASLKQIPSYSRVC